MVNWKKGWKRSGFKTIEGSPVSSLPEPENEKPVTQAELLIFLKEHVRFEDANQSTSTFCTQYAHIVTEFDLPWYRLVRQSPPLQHDSIPNPIYPSDTVRFLALENDLEATRYTDGIELLEVLIQAAMDEMSTDSQIIHTRKPLVTKLAQPYWAVSANVKTSKSILLNASKQRAGLSSSSKSVTFRSNLSDEYNVIVVGTDLEEDDQDETQATKSFTATSSTNSAACGQWECSNFFEPPSCNTEPCKLHALDCYNHEEKQDDERSFATRSTCATEYTTNTEGLGVACTGMCIGPSTLLFGKRQESNQPRPRFTLENLDQCLTEDETFATQEEDDETVQTQDESTYVNETISTATTDEADQESEVSSRFEDRDDEPTLDQENSPPAILQDNRAVILQQTKSQSSATSSSFTSSTDSFPPQAFRYDSVNARMEANRDWNALFPPDPFASWAQVPKQTTPTNQNTPTNQSNQNTQTNQSTPANQNTPTNQTSPVKDANIPIKPTPPTQLPPPSPKTLPPVVNTTQIMTRSKVLAASPKKKVVATKNLSLAQASSSWTGKNQQQSSPRKPFTKQFVVEQRK